MRFKTENRIRVVIVGAGFAGLSAAKRLAKQRELDVLVIDRNNYHTFQPLLYQVAAAELGAEAIANPLRGLFRKRRNISVAMCEVIGCDIKKRILYTDGPNIPYDYLILATGSTTNFFGTPGAEEYAFTLKSLEEAVRIRSHILQCFEQEALEPNDKGGKQPEQTGRTHIVIVGGGPTGVEYGGALAELIRTPIARDFPEMPKGFARVTLLDACEEILPGFPPNLQRYAHKRLERMGVTVITNAQVKEVQANGVLLANDILIPSMTVVWTAGVRGNDLAAKMGLPLGHADRVETLATLQCTAHPEIFIAGDLSLPQELNPPMVAPNAVQQGRLAADNIICMIREKTPMPFVYRDKGSLATIGRNAAVARFGRLRFFGFIAWLLWLVVHLTYLIGFHNRLMVLISWAWDYLFFERSVRLILPRRSVLKELCQNLFKNDHSTTDSSFE